MRRKNEKPITRRQFLQESTVGTAAAALSGVLRVRTTAALPSQPHLPPKHSPPPPDDLQRLWYKQPANKWGEALPIGNGRLGAMVFGGTEYERLQINEATLWAGGPHDYDNADAGKHLDRLRQLIFTGKIVEADELGYLILGIPPRQQPFQPFCDLRLTLPGHGSATNYVRDLALDDAVAGVRYEVRGTAYTREAFCSHPDQVLVVRLTCSKKGQLDFAAALDGPQRNTSALPQGRDSVRLSGQLGTREAPTTPADSASIWNASWNGSGLRFEARLHVHVEGGSVSAEGNRVQVRAANAATLILAAATSYKSYQDISGDPRTEVERRLASALTKSYRQLRQAHVADYQTLFRRVSVNFGMRAGESQPTDVRIRHCDGANDPQLASLYFQLGRYLLISSSRPGGLPANLQGLWNQDLWPAWGSKWTTNINVQMNYWPAEVTNLAECHLPLLDLVDSLRVPGRKTASLLYGCRGFVLHHNTDLWHATAPCDGPWGVWPMGAVWLSTHFYEHYEFTQNDAFLREQAYPLMKEAAQFVLDFLVEAPPGTACPGALVSNPSFSPENIYGLPAGGTGRLTYACTMDLELIDQLFRNCIQAAQHLGVDTEFVNHLGQTLRRLPPLQVGKRGQLQEWIVDYDETQPENSHCSPMFGLYPGNTIARGGTPKLVAAARKSLELRGDGGGGFGGAWRVCLWARLHEGDHAHKILVNHIANSTLPSMVDPEEPYELDGNFGGAAGIAEMLLQSHTGEIHLLPALPAAWPSGSIRGLCARGGFEVEIEWEHGQLTEATLISKRGATCTVRYRSKTVSFETQAGGSYQINGELQPAK